MKEDLLNILVGKAFLFLTTTDIETDTFLSELMPLVGKQVIKIAIGNHTYHIGKFGCYPTVHVQCNSMGMINPGASITTAIEAIEQWSPVGVVIVGIAFGINKKKQHIGDVLVSHSIIDYESAKLSLGRKEYRNHNVISGNILYDRFKNMRSWEFLLPKNQRAQPIFGDILSGEKLVDDQNVIKELKSVFTTTIGGEMESYGVFTACKNAGISEWIMVKGICDWADGSKSVKKDYRQRIAAQSAISLCKAVFSEKVFEDICTPEYKRKADMRESDVGYESNIISIEETLISKEEIRKAILERVLNTKHFLIRLVDKINHDSDLGDTLEKMQNNMHDIYVLYASYDTFLSNQELKKLICIVDTWNKFVSVYNETSETFSRRKESKEAEKKLHQLETVWNIYHKNLLECCNEVIELYN